MARPTKQNEKHRTIMTNIRMNAEEFERFNLVCSSLNLSRSELIVRIVDFMASLLSESIQADKDIIEEQKRA